MSQNSIATAMYLQYMKDKRLSAGTIEKYIRNIDHFIKWYHQEYQHPFNINTCTDEIIKQYQQYLYHNRCNSESTIKYKLASIKNYFEYMYMKGKLDNYINIKYIPIEEKENTRKNKKEFRTLSRYQVDTILRLKNKRDIAMISLMLNTNIGLNELCNLKRTDIQVVDGITVMTIKNKNIVLNTRTAKLLHEYLEERSDKNPYVFIGKNSRRKMSRIAIHNLLKSYGNKLKCELNYRVLNRTFYNECAAALHVTDVKGINDLIQNLNKNPAQAKIFFDKLYSENVEENRYWR